MTQNRSSVDRTGARSIRHNEIVVTGHAIDQFLARVIDPPQGAGRDFEKHVGRLLASIIRTAIYLKDHKECKLYYKDNMVYVIKVFPNYKKLLTCYPRILN